MKILHLNSNYLYTTLFDKMTLELEKKGIDNVVFMPISGKGKFVIDPRESVYYPITFNKVDRYFYHYKQAKIFSKLEKTFSSFSYDIVHAHTLFTDGHIAYKLKKKYELPYIVTVRNTDINTFFKKMIHLRKLGINVLKNADGIILLSETYKNILLENYIPNNLKEEIETKINIIPNGIDKFWFLNKGTPKTLFNNKKINILYVGAINKNKNVLATIRALNILQEKGINVKFTVIGKIYDESVYKQIKDLKFVSYLPPVEKEELIKVYRKNDVFVMPSITESFGLVYAEAMSQGLPVIYTKNQGFDSQFVEGLVGYSVNCFNEKEIAEKILETIKNYNKLSINCLNFCDKFDWEKISENYSEIYKENSSYKNNSEI